LNKPPQLHRGNNENRPEGQKEREKMQTTTHSPAPWEADTDTGEIYARRDGHILTMRSTALNPCFTTKTPAVQAANARLIAAAPALLSACIDLLAHWGMELRTPEDAVRSDAILEDARAAIAKATTEQEKELVKFVNIDGWNRPIFRSIKFKRNFYGCTDKLFPFETGEAEVLEKITEADLCFFGNRFNCEPMGTPANNLEIVRA
jgi:hypothetical protein